MIKKILSLTLSAFIALSSSGCGNASAAEASPTAQEVAADMGIGLAVVPAVMALAAAQVTKRR